MCPLSVDRATDGQGTSIHSFGHDDPRLETNVIPMDGHTVLAVRGEIEPSTVEQFGRAIEAAFTQSPVVVIDARELTFIDSSGLKELVRAQRRHGQTPDALVLRAPSQFLLQLLKITGIDQIMNIECGPVPATSTEPAAIASRSELTDEAHT